MSNNAQFINTSGEVVQAQDAQDAANMRAAGVPEATKEQVSAAALKAQYSSDWHNHPILAAFHTAEAGALGVARAIPGLNTAATGYTQLADLAISNLTGGPSEITKNFQDYEKAEGENHPVATALGELGGGAAVGTLGGAAAAGYSPNAIMAVGAAQGLGGALDRAAMDHALTPAGAEKVGALTASLALSALTGAVFARGADYLAGGLVSGAVGRAGKALQDAAPAVASAVAPVAKGLGIAAAGAGMLGEGASAAGLYGAKKAVQAAPRVVAGLGKAMNGFDWLVAKAVNAGLYEEPVVGAATELFSHTDYNRLTNGLDMANTRPADVVGALGTHMTAEGVPAEIVDTATMQNARALAYLSSQKPTQPFNQGQTVAPVQTAPSLREQVEFVDKVNAVQNPTWALQNPNDSRMAALKAVYPALVNSVQGLVSANTATQPGLSLQGRAWAGKITGRPATPMDDPRMGAIRMVLDAQASQALQQAKQKKQTSSGSDEVADSYQTQAQRLAR